MNKINSEFESIMDSRMFRHVPGAANPGFGVQRDDYTSVTGSINIHCLMLIDSMHYQVRINHMDSSVPSLRWSGRDLNRFRQVLDEYMVNAGAASSALSEEPMSQEELNVVHAELVEVHHQYTEGLVTLTEYLNKVVDMRLHIGLRTNLCGLIDPGTGLQYPTQEELRAVDAEDWRTT